MADFGDRFRELRKQADRLSRRLVITLADEFDLTPRECVARLERNGLAPKGSWDWFTENGGITDRHVMETRAEKKLK